jgi:LacI family transcriptional regulator
VDRLLSLQVPGIAFLTTQVDQPLKEHLARRGICTVYLGFGTAKPLIANIAIRNEGIREGVDHLVSLGHRRVGFIGGPVDGVFAQSRKAAFLDAAHAAQLETRVFDSDLTVQGAYYGCSRLLAGFPATAIMTGNDLMAIGALHYAYDRRIAVPAELSIIGFDDITFAQFTQPALTTVTVPRAEIGRLAVQSLKSLIRERGTGADHEMKTHLVVRQTTGPVL